MADARRSRAIAAPVDEVWRLIEDPHHMARWWPEVVRVEGVSEDRFTHVYVSKRGRTVRMDFVVLASEPPRRRVWEQELAGTPFERVLGQSVTEIALKPEGDGTTRVALALRQQLRGYNRTGGFMLKRAARHRLDAALDGLARVVVGPAT